MKLIYFNIQGRGEVLRMIMEYKGIPYEDVRIDKKTQWADLKPQMPFGFLPVLETDGYMLSESRAIARYLAKVPGTRAGIGNIAGETELDQAKIDQAADFIEGILDPFFSALGEPDKEKQAARLKEYETVFFPKFLTMYENLLTEGGGTICGGEITWADIKFVAEVPSTEEMGIFIDRQKFKKIAAMMDRVNNDERIAAWIKRRP